MVVKCLQHVKKKIKNWQDMPDTSRTYTFRSVNERNQSRAV